MLRISISADALLIGVLDILLNLPLDAASRPRTLRAWNDIQTSPCKLTGARGTCFVNSRVEPVMALPASLVRVLLAVAFALG